jgi:hypothetical protein
MLSRLASRCGGANGMIVAGIVSQALIWIPPNVFVLGT